MGSIVKHLINGKKVARLYSHWYHIPEQVHEINEIVITLNANSHASLTLKGRSISAQLKNFESKQRALNS